MLRLSEATPKDFHIIRSIAYATWPVTYGNILSSQQLEYMLGLFYSQEMLEKNFREKGHRFLLVHEGSETLGFASYEHHYLQTNVTRLHKLYVLPEAQGKQAGALLLSEVEQLARTANSKAVSLNVNKFNKAYSFYLKKGFVVVGEIDLPIGDGYLMEDYVMEKAL
jgi:GNAT superfamily N-acetyltransferase